MGTVGKDLFPVFACIRPPRAGRVDQVRLDIEDELVTCEGTAGSGALVNRLFWQPKTAARITLCCERLVERSEGRGGRAQRLQKGAPANAKVLSVDANPVRGRAR